MCWIIFLLLFVCGITAIGEAVINKINTERSNSVKALEDDGIIGYTVRKVSKTVVDIHQFPYQVSLRYHGHIICGGSIISEKHVLTAAHCVVSKKPELLEIRAGSTFASEGGKLYNVSTIAIHPGFRGSDYDIALLEMEENMALDGATTRAVRLPEPGRSLRAGVKVVVSGWGSVYEGGPHSEILRAVTIPVTSTKVCKNTYKYYTGRIFCAGFPEGGKDACQGDSGGPAVAESSLIQYGIVSFGNGCGRRASPGGYTNIPAVRGWITQVTGI